MTNPKTVRKKAKRKILAAKTQMATEAIGKIEKNTDTFILTYGQFSLIDALCAILDQTGPADVTISTWTAADAHLEKSAALMATAQIKDFRLIVDRSFEARQPAYCHHMRELFGPECVRAIHTHAKFMLIRSETHDIVVRTSMNLNGNPRLENIEVSEDSEFAEFFQTVADGIFSEVREGQNMEGLPGLKNVQEELPFKKINAGVIKRKNLNEPRTTHAVI